MAVSAAVEEASEGAEHREGGEPMGALKYFTDEHLKQIEEAVASAEKKTSGEIVTLIVRSSDRYYWIAPLWAGAVGFLTSLAVEIASYFSHWPLPLSEFFSLQLAGFGTGFLIGLWPPARRLVMGRKLSAERVHRECLASFLSLGLTETRDRTGVFIYISEFERVVEIIADKAIHEKCGSSYWQEQVNLIIRGLKQHGGFEALKEAIYQIGEKLALSFPPRPDDTNELPNAPRIGD